MDAEDIPDEVLKAAREADHEHAVRLFNEALQALVVAQKRLQLRNVRSTIEPNGAMTISVFADAEGKNVEPYASMEMLGRKFAVVGELSEVPMSHPGDIAEMKKD